MVHASTKLPDIMPECLAIACAYTLCGVPRFLVMHYMYGRPLVGLNTSRGYDSPLLLFKTT